MSEDTCPECGEEYISKSRFDARPEGALAESYIHEKSGPFVEESCIHVLKWGDESPHAE